MIIEIRGAGFVNKGAELMLVAIVQKIRSRYPNAKITMAPIYGGSEDTYDKMRSLNVYPKAWFWYKGVDFGEFSKFLPSKIVTRYGLVLPHEVDVVIDASGFVYSDQWGVASSKEFAISSRKWKKYNAKVIAMPQAFGPFRAKGARKYVSEWVNNSDLVFARESDSYNYLTEVVGKRDNIMVCPDFTNVVEGLVPDNYDSSNKEVAIVPNCRMLDKTDQSDKDAYLPFLIDAAKYIFEKGRKPFLLVHEGSGDYALAESVSSAIGGMPIITESDPIYIKGILGSCYATVGSRFHGLVSALSQGVPSLATGWSHKYQQLFQDYNFPEGVLNIKDGRDELYRMLDVVIDPESSAAVSNVLLEKSSDLKSDVENMWNVIFSIIDSVEKRTNDSSV